MEQINEYYLLCELSLGTVSHPTIKLFTSIASESALTQFFKKVGEPICIKIGGGTFETIII